MHVKFGVSPKEEYRLKIFQNKVLRRIFGLKKEAVTGS
jgi:hypothetical protein